MADTESPKIVSLFTRQEYIPPDPDKIDSSSVRMLKHLLKMAEHGKITGVCVLAMNQTHQVPFIFTNFPPDMDPMQAAWMYLGMSEELRSCLRDIAVHGIDELARLAEEEDDGDDSA